MRRFNPHSDAHCRVCGLKKQKNASHARRNDYRISDGLLRQYDAPGCETYPTSLVCKYHVEAAGSKTLDLEALIRVLEQIERQEPVWRYHSKNTALVHLRLGDGLCAQYDPRCRGPRTDIPNCWETDEDCFVNPDSVTKQYAFSSRWYRDIFMHLESLHVRHVIIIGDKYHWTRTPDPRKGKYSIDDTYVAHVADAFRNRDFSVTVREPTSPDEDFVRMCSARTFVQGGGGYSALIAYVVNSRGGIVLRPSTDG
jgi:hypothetical protein